MSELGVCLRMKKTSTDVIQAKTYLFVSCFIIINTMNAGDSIPLDAVSAVSLLIVERVDSFF